MKDFIVLVALGLIFAVPIWVYYTEQWLSNSANAVPVDWYYYVMPTALLASITILLVIVQTIKTANTNPTRYLKQD
ncbi:MAG: putative ABC transport system permease protein [Cyclobacteriaceae bacterium]|jgi:putative ABC transport system permease protein